MRVFSIKYILYTICNTMKYNILYDVNTMLYVIKYDLHLSVFIDNINILTYTRS